MAVRARAHPHESPPANDDAGLEPWEVAWIQALARADAHREYDALLRSRETTADDRPDL